MANVHIPGVQIALPMEATAEFCFCRKWKIEELALFGLVLREDFRPDSDIDVLVTFAADVVLSIHDYLGMKQERETLFGRKVDLLDRPTLEKSWNYIRRDSILHTAQIIYES